MEPEKLTFQLLREMTADFSDERKLGQGAYGAVYMGESTNGKKIAVKKLHDNAINLDDKKFQHEFDNLKMLRHKNIIQLIGYCYEKEIVPIEYNGKLVPAEKTYRALCMEYMHNRSLENHLSDDLHKLDWQTRFKIIMGICKGLKYMHEELDEPIYHLDLKPANILLSMQMVPKLADFGLSRIFSEELTRITSTPAGTPGYVPPEYIERNEISKKFDIFSLGVVMLMIVSGREGYSNYSYMASDEFVDQVHGKWRSILQATWSGSSLEMYCEQVKRCTKIALNCLEKNKHKRPNIEDIIYKLKGLYYCQQSMLRMVLFLHQFVAGHNKPNRNEEFVIGVNHPHGFGTTLVHDRAVTTTTDPNGTIVARAQGLHMQAGQTVDNAWYTTFNLVFQDERYAGSTLQVMGTLTQHINAELSIIGGTGQFRRATGTIELSPMPCSSAEDCINKLDIQVFYTPNSP